MKKVTKLLSVFLIAGVVGTGVAGIAGCSNKDEHTHTAGTTWVSDATNHWHTCTADDGAKLDEAAHTEVVDAAVSATCTTAGKSEGKHCSVCNAVIVAQEVVAAKGHTEVVDKAVEATCTTAGKTEGKHCSVCNTVIVKQEDVAAKGHTYVYTDKGDGTHGITCELGDLTETTEAHVDENKDNKCDKCGNQASVPVTGFVIEENTSALIVEGIQTEYDLSPSLKSAKIDLSNIKVYLDNKGERGKEVTAENYSVKLYDGLTELESLEGLTKDGNYSLFVDLKDAKKPDGTAVAAEEIYKDVTITVKNAYTAIALKEGTTTQVQGADVIKSTWTYEATRANGDKEVISADKVTVGTMDTNSAGEKTVTITLNGTEVTGTVTYTITEDKTKVAQSYAMNFGYLTAEQETDIKAGKAVSLQNGRFEVQSTTGGEVASHNKEYDGKYFAKRLKVNGASTAKDCKRYIKVKADGEGTITVYAYNNGGSAGDGGTRGVALYKDRTVGEVGGKDEYTNQVGTTLAVPSKTHAKTTFTITEAGDYYVTCDAGMTFCYVQLDQLVKGGEGVEEVKLTGTDVVSEINVTEPTEVSNFKVGDTFTHDGYVVKATAVNNATCESGEKDVTAEAQFTAPDMTTIGEKEVTVSYGGATATYKVIVETAVAGIYGAKATLASTVNTQVSSASGTVTITKENVEVALVGENANATTEYTVKKGEEEITTGTALGIGEHTLTVTVTVTDSVANTTDTIVTELVVKIEQEAAAGATQSFLVPDEAITDAATKVIAAGGTITDNTLFTVTTEAEMNYNIGKDATAGVGNPNKAVTVTLQDGTSKTFKQGISTMTDTAAGGASTSYTVKAKNKIELILYTTYCNNSYNSQRSADINYTVSGGAAQKTPVSDRTQIAVIKVTLEEGQTLTVNASNTNNTGRLWLFGVEAKAV